MCRCFICSFGTIYIMLVACLLGFLHLLHFLLIFFPYLSTCLLPPFPSNRHHQSNDDCLEGKGENYQVCCVQYCVQQLCTVQCIYIWTDLTVLWIGFCLSGPISLCLDSFRVCMYFLYDCILHACLVLQHGEVDLVGMKPILRTTTSFSALTLSVGSFDP